ncbi:hypothetical protein FZEAL_5949 [Fusarium zealandicum]|uniref:Tat pathway signal sequence n=1 Tax=Fusarium zealandicum TaxID=1053134 RepID=A0A8H4XJB8_9HYPO|nr:hypothetical protein FZEAL_5949 [Fusarium zealandicum]
MAHKEQEASPFNPHVDGNDSDEDGESYHYVPQQRRRLSACRCFGWAIALATIILISALSGAWISMAYLNIDQNCAAHTSQWSPLLGDVAIEYTRKSFDGNFMQENIFRKNSSPEVDAAWEALGVDYRPGVISYEDGLASGLDPSFVQRSPEHGGGFIVNVEGMHHLHCLNLVRKSLWFNYDYYKDMGTHAFKNHGDVFRLHVTHCLDTIRQVLMCNVDTGVLGQVWVNPEDPTAFPDFNTQHTCKNYEEVMKWAEELQAPPSDGLPEDFLAPPKKGDVLPSTP